MRAMQFELWPECNVGCNFCYLLREIRKTDDDIKIRNINRAIDFLNSKELEDYTIIAFIGGEFMQGQLKNPYVKSCFFRLLSLVKDRIVAGKLEGAWMSAALTQPSDTLFEVLDLFKEVKAPSLTGGFWIVTSWDTKYRFKGKHTEENWKNNLRAINQYPNIKINTSTVLTGDLVEKYNAGMFRFQPMIEEFNTQWFFKPPHFIHHLYDDKYAMEKALPGFFPKRKDFLKFLSLVSLEEECYVWDKICNIHFRADTLLRSETDKLEYREKETRYEIAGYDILPCGHNVTYAGYIDSDACMLCDKLAMS